MERIFKEHSFRKITSLNGDWKFCIDQNNIGENEQWYKNFPENFRYINVPGCWNLELDLFNYVGKAWYLKEFETDDTYLQISFGAVTGNAQVFLDGEFLGEHYGGWLEFKFERFVTKGFHSLVVCVDNTPNAVNTIHLKVVDWYNYGGIMRSVEIAQFNKPYIENCKISYFLNEELTEAVLSAEITLNNPFKSTYITDLELYLNGEILRKMPLSVTGNGTFYINDIKISNIELWEIGNGRLYDIRIKTADDDLFDKKGFRKIEAKNKNIYLNNKPVFIKGANRHEQHPDWGFSVPSNINKRDVDIAKNLNCNFIRGAHYPNSKTFLDYLDREGIMFWSEIPMWQYRLDSLTDDLMQNRAFKMYEEMLDQYYNHPSIVIWGMHNEIATEIEEAYTFTKKAYEYIKSKDTSRLITYATCKFDKDICFDFADVVCINTYHGWYFGTINDWAKYIKNLRPSLVERGYGDKPVVISEFGAAALYGNSSFNNNKWSMEYQSDIIEEVVKNCLAEDGVCGALVWHFCDTPSDKDLAKANGFNNKGILDAYRRPKIAYYTLKKLYENIK